MTDQKDKLFFVDIFLSLQTEMMWAEPRNMRSFFFVLLTCVQLETCNRPAAPLFKQTTTIEKDTESIEEEDATFFFATKMNWFALQLNRTE